MWNIAILNCILLSHYILHRGIVVCYFVQTLSLFVCLFAEKEQQEAIEHIDEVQNEIDR